LKVVLWISDKQDAFLKCIAEEFSGVPHRYCENHFFRDLAKPVLDMDSTAKKKMRGKIRGLRALELFFRVSLRKYLGKFWRAWNEQAALW
jgi:hypothetical protein